MQADYRLEMFKECLVAVHAKDDLAFYKQALLDQINLLERQILIEVSSSLITLRQLTCTYSKQTLLSHLHVRLCF